MLRQARWLLLVLLSLSPLGCARQPVAPPAPTEPPAGVQTIAWSDDYQAALAQAKQENKPLMVDVFATWCVYCKQLDENVFSRADVAQASAGFVPVKVDGDKHPDLKQKLGVKGYPTVVFLSPDGKEISRVRGAAPYQTMLDAMASASR